MMTTYTTVLKLILKTSLTLLTLTLTPTQPRTETCIIHLYGNILTRTETHIVHMYGLDYNLNTEW